MCVVDKSKKMQQSSVVSKPAVTVSDLYIYKTILNHRQAGTYDGFFMYDVINKNNFFDIACTKGDKTS